MNKYADVAVDAPAGHSRTFNYSVPPSLQVEEGQLVIVPFGPRQLQGLVFSLISAPQVQETRDIYSIPAGAPVLNSVQLELARWISNYYQCSLFEAAVPMLPPGGRLRLKPYLTLTPSLDSFPVRGLSLTHTEVLRYVRNEGKVPEEKIWRVIGKSSRGAIGWLVEKGYLVRSMARTSISVGPKVRNYIRLAPAGARPLSSQMLSLSRRAPRQVELLENLEEIESSVPLSEARKKYGHGAVSSMLAKGWILKEVVSISRDPLAGRHFASASRVSLTSHQSNAVDAIREAINTSSTAHNRLLIQGVTGSGKTEIYLEAVQHCLKIGRKAIVMVPEIALMDQTIERFGVRFPGEVAVMHSGLSAGQRFDQWWKIKNGEYGVVIGSRGAVFAPQPDLGIIVIDEEHEWTYKQHDSNPRYHARDVARQLAKLSDAVVLSGSATPDLVSYYDSQAGGSSLLSLPNRVHSDHRSFELSTGHSGLADAEIIDMRRELKSGNRGMFSRVLNRAIVDCLDSGAQALLFINRRGTSSFMQCRKCGHGLKCRRCDVGMSYHKQAGRLICHYCADRRLVPTECPNCHSHRLSYYGLGTQAVVDELHSSFPDAKVLRWDRDSAKSPDEHRNMLEGFRAGEAQILVGTQMIAKGLHFPSVTLVGAVLADVGLYVPDFRAGERAYQLLCQVAGRAGRGSREGKAIVQTYQPENYAIMAAAAQDYSCFYQQEIGRRREQGNPPFGRLIRLLYNHANWSQCEANAIRLAERLRDEAERWGISEVDILGPTSGYPSRLRGRFRTQIILRSVQPRLLLDKVTVPQGWIVDVDPVGMA